MSKILYEKRGRRYYPVAEDASERFACFPRGMYLVDIHPGGYSLARMLAPANAEVEAAIKIAKDAMVEAMRQANQSPGKPDLPTAEERELAAKAYKAYCEILGEEKLVSFRGISMHDVVEAGLAVLRERLYANGITPEQRLRRMGAFEQKATTASTVPHNAVAEDYE